MPTIMAYPIANVCKHDAVFVILSYMSKQKFDDADDNDDGDDDDDDATE